MRVILALFFGGAVSTLATAAHAQEIDWQKVDAALDRRPAVSGDVHRYGFPRTDLEVRVAQLDYDRLGPSAAHDVDRKQLRR
jgi:hypothetical protein